MVRKYYNIRVEDPKKFKWKRVKDVGQEEHLKIVHGLKKGKEKSSLQAYRVELRDFEIRDEKLVPKSEIGKREHDLITHHGKYEIIQKKLKKTRKGYSYRNKDGKKIKVSKKSWVSTHDFILVEKKKTSN